MGRLASHTTITEEDLHTLVTGNPGFEGLGPGDTLPATANLIMVRREDDVPRDHGVVWFRGLIAHIALQPRTHEVLMGLISQTARDMALSIIMTVTFFAARAPLRTRVDIYLIDARAHAVAPNPGFVDIAMEYQTTVVNQ